MKRALYKCGILLLLLLFLGDIESDHVTVSNSEINTFDFHCL